MKLVIIIYYNQILDMLHFRKFPITSKAIKNFKVLFIYIYIYNWFHVYVKWNIVTHYTYIGLMVKLKLQYFHLMWRANLMEKTLLLGMIEGRRRRGWQRMRWLGWHHWFNGHELGQTPGDGEGQGSLTCCSPWGCEELDMT